MMKERNTMNHLETLNSAVGMLTEKGHLYGPEDQCFERISVIATAVLGKNISTYDVAMIHHATKLARMMTARTHQDNYVDGINYLAFASQFSTRKDSLGVAMEDDIRAMAQKLAPMPQAVSLTTVTSESTSI